MITLTNEQLQEILVSLPLHYPKSLQIDSIIRNRLSGTYDWPGTEILADSYPEYAVLWCRPITGSTEYVPSPEPYTVVLFCKDIQKLENVLRSDDFVDLSQRVFFFAVSKADVWPALKETCEEAHNIVAVIKGIDSEGIVHLMHPSFLRKSELPEGFQIRELLEEHAEQVNASWTYGSSTTLRYFQHALRNKFPSSGVFTDDGRLVAHILCNFDGSMTAGYVDPDYRRRGLYQVVNYDLATKLVAMGHPFAWAYVVKSNLPSLHAYETLGARKVDPEKFSIDFQLFRPKQL